MKKKMFTSRNLSFLQILLLSALPVAALTIFCCARTVTVTIPPRIGLTEYQAIGIVDFLSQPPGILGKEATRKFIENLHAAQPGIRIIEVGSQANVLKDSGYDEIDFKSIRVIGDQFGVAVVLTGTVELSEPQPDVNLTTDLEVLSAGVKAKVEGRMSAELWETSSGATIWSNSSWGSWTVGGVRLDNKGRLSAGYNYPVQKQDQIIMELVRVLSSDFWPSYEKRKVEE